MLNLLIKGGWVMYPILACSVIAVAIAAERIVQYVISRNRKENSIDKLYGLISTGKFDQAFEHFKSGKSHLYRITAAYLKSRNERQDVLEESLHVTATGEVSRLENHLSHLSLIANLATLLGLLGTVIGMILVFAEIAKAGGQAEMAQLADGVWQALLTTAFGLIVAVPVMAVHHFLQKHVDKCISEIEMRISYLNILFKRKISVNEEELYEETGETDDVSTDTAKIASGGVY